MFNVEYLSSLIEKAWLPHLPNPLQKLTAKTWQGFSTFDKMSVLKQVAICLSKTEIQHSSSATVKTKTAHFVKPFFCLDISYTEGQTFLC